MLIDKGADVNARGVRGVTPLHVASNYGRMEEVELLLAKGANVQAKDDTGLTAADLAEERGHFEVVKRLQRAAVTGA